MFLVGKTYSTRQGGWKLTIQAITKDYLFGIFNNGSYGVFDPDGYCRATTMCPRGDSSFNLVGKK